MTAIPAFPATVAAHSADPDAVTAAGPRDEVVSDYQWLSLRAWNPDAELSLLDGALVIAFAGYHDTDERFYGFVGGNDPAAIAGALITESERRGWGPELQLVPASVTAQLDDRFQIDADADNHDYLYEPARFVTLDGPEHKTNRSELRFYQRSFGDRSTVTVHPAGDAPWDDIIDLTEQWSTVAGDQDAAVDENAAVRRCRAVLDDGRDGSDVYVTTIAVAGDLIGYDVTELCVDGWALNHFRHTTRAFRGSHMEIRAATGAWLEQLGVHSWNAEQDLGVTGLRARKQLDRPSGFIEKYTVRRREP